MTAPQDRPRLLPLSRRNDACRPPVRIAPDPVVWPGSVYAWLCTSATVEGLARGRACWAARQIGESTHPGQRVSAKDRCPGGEGQRVRLLTVPPGATATNSCS